MLLSFDETTKIIQTGKLLHIAGTETLLKKLPEGNWIGGSTEYFIAEGGGKVSDALLFVTECPHKAFKISIYDENDISDVTDDAYDNGYSIIVLPFDSAVHKEYAAKAAQFNGMFIKNIVGWIAGTNLNKPEQTPIALNGRTGEAFSNKAVVAHISVPAEKTVSIDIINIFKQDEHSPLIQFYADGFSAAACLVDGDDVNLAEYIAQNNIDTRFPLVGDYSGTGINVSFKDIDNGTVNFYAPVFSEIKYRFAEPVTDYAAQFNRRLKALNDVRSAFSCNCVLNFLYGELEGKNIDTFFGPVTFGEVAYQLVNQTLAYVTVV